MASPFNTIPEELYSHIWNYGVRGDMCCLHEDVDGANVGAIITFAHGTLMKCQETLKIRQEKQLGGTHFLLPEDINTSEGFHISCYYKFINLAERKTVKRHLHPSLLRTNYQPKNTKSCLSNARSYSPEKCVAKSDGIGDYRRQPLNINRKVPGSNTYRHRKDHVCKNHYPEMSCYLKIWFSWVRNTHTTC